MLLDKPKANIITEINKPKSFLLSDTLTANPFADSLPAHYEGGFEQVRVLVIGSQYGVTSTIQTLYVLGFAAVGQWSPLLRAPGSGEWMRILTRRIARPIL
jgi:hypothetical protein